MVFIRIFLGGYRSNAMHISFHCATFALYIIIINALMVWNSKIGPIFLWHGEQRKKKLMYNLWENQLIWLFCIRVASVRERSFQRNY